MKIKIDEFCTQIIIVLSTIMLGFSGFLGIDATKYCLYIITALCCIKLIQIKFRQIHFVLLVLLILFSLFIVLVYKGNWSSWFVFVTSVFFLISVSRNGIEVTTWKLLKICAYLTSFLFIALWLISPTYTEYGQLVLYFDNPNMTGIALSAPAMILVLAVTESKGKTFNAISIFILIIMMYMVFITQNRGSFFSILILAISAMFAINKKKTKKISNAWIWGIFKLTPIVVMFIYVGLFIILPENTELMSKPLFSGREEAWIFALQKIFYNPFAFHRFEEGTLNLFLEGATRYGIFSMIAYFTLLIALGKKKDEIAKMNVLSYLAYVAFHCCLVQQSFESTMLTGSYSIYIWSYLLLGIASIKSLDAIDNEKVNKETIEGISKI